MKIVLLVAHSSSTDWYDLALAEYEKKISYFASFEVKKIKTKKIDRNDSQLKKEADSEALLENLQPQDYVILLDEKGINVDSVALSKKFQKIIDQSPKRIVFVIGGPYGSSDQLKKRAQWTLSLSAMTMNHWVAQVVVLEQIYRSFTIIKNIPYHNN